jgi:hypothetical protein
MQATQLRREKVTPAKKTGAISAKALVGKVAKKVREDSRSLGKPTSIDSIKALAPDLKTEDTDAVLQAIATKEKYWDIKPVRAVTRLDYLFSNQYLTQEQAGRLALIGEFETDLVAQVREKSRTEKMVRLSSVAGVGPELKTAEIEAGLAGIAGNPEYKDIKQAVTFSGAAFLYSDQSLTQDRAEVLARHEELQTKTLIRIREDSQYSAKLTGFSSLSTLAPDLKPGEIEGILNEITQDATDIKSLPARKGPGYFFSIRHMTENYARILARVEANDPLYTIVEMVREESRIYPHPTNIELFKYGMFNVDRDRLDDYVKQVVEENEDINGYRSSKGNVYLYCTQYLPDERAALIVERDEHPE